MFFILKFVYLNALSFFLCIEKYQLQQNHYGSSRTLQFVFCLDSSALPRLSKDEQLLFLTMRSGNSPANYLTASVFCYNMPMNLLDIFSPVFLLFSSDDKIKINYLESRYAFD